MRNFKVYIAIASLLMLLYIVAEYNRPTPTNWSPTLYYKDKIPFGTYVVYHQLHDVFPQADIANTNKSIYSTLHDSVMKAGNYLIISKSVSINKFDFAELMKYIKAGNNVFISAFNYKGFLTDTLKLSTTYEAGKGNATINFTSRQLAQTVPYRFTRDISNQYFFNFDTTKAIVVAKNNYGHATYLRFKFGSGSLYLDVNPGLFTNYSLLNKPGDDYAAKALSFMPAAKNVYWDEYQNGDIANDDSPLRVFFEHPALQWAYYLSLFGIFIFILFEMKRRQRIIPIINPLENSTLNFVKVVGQVYYENRNNANIAHKKVLYLLAHLRDDYQIRTTQIDNDFMERLIAKLGLERPFAYALVSHLRYITNQQHVTDTELIELNKLVEQFYTQSR
jgi:hypothetical protein